MKAVKTVGIKYCGGCNPEIDRSRVARLLQGRLPQGFRLIPPTAPAPWDIGILLCGCAAGCAKRPEILSSALLWILVCGPHVDDVAVGGGGIAEAIVQKLSRIGWGTSFWKKAP